MARGFHAIEQAAFDKSCSLIYGLSQEATAARSLGLPPGLEALIMVPDNATFHFHSQQQGSNR